MNGYFKPWRRKVGVVTLLLACVFILMSIIVVNRQATPIDISDATVVDADKAIGSRVVVDGIYRGHKDAKFVETANFDAEIDLPLGVTPKMPDGRWPKQGETIRVTGILNPLTDPRRQRFRYRVVFHKWESAPKHSAATGSAPRGTD